MLPTRDLRIERKKRRFILQGPPWRASVTSITQYPQSILPSSPRDVLLQFCRRLPGFWEKSAGLPFWHHRPAVLPTNCSQPRISPRVTSATRTLATSFFVFWSSAESRLDRSQGSTPAWHRPKPSRDDAKSRAAAFDGAGSGLLEARHHVWLAAFVRCPPTSHLTLRAQYLPRSPIFLRFRSPSATLSLSPRWPLQQTRLCMTRMPATMQECSH